jgi:hypothetical protein
MRDLPMQNPFTLKEIPVSAPFCDRDQELQTLYSHALNKANVVLFSPRRYGKTSLVKRLQSKLAENGVVTVYVDLYGISSIESVAERLVTKLYAYCHKDESLFKKAMHFIASWRPVLKPDTESGLALTVEPITNRNGTELLDDTLTELGNFSAAHEVDFHIVLDEFQEITELREANRIEGIMRSHIQAHNKASYFFVGSRRRILLDIFNNHKRAFYKSAINFELKPLPEMEAVNFMVDRFKDGGKECSTEIAKLIYDKVSGYPYYIQRIPYTIYETAAAEKITREDYIRGFSQTIEEEKPFYEAMLNALSIQQMSLLYALAEESMDKPFSMAYMSKHKLKSVGGVQGALKRLLALDYIEKRENGKYYVVDPVFATWATGIRG